MTQPEPSVWDYVKARLAPWRGPAPQIPPLEAGNGQIEPALEPPTVPPAETSPALKPEATQERPLEPGKTPWSLQASALPPARAWPWRSLAALGLALFAQLSFEPSSSRSPQFGLLLYFFAVLLLGWAWTKSEWHLSLKADLEYSRETFHPPVFIASHGAFVAGLAFTALAFLTLGGNRFTQLNVFLWVLAIVFMARAFWQPDGTVKRWTGRLQGFLHNPQTVIRLTPWTLFVLMVLVASVFFRAFALETVPPQMNSDHAEKLLDVADVLDGTRPIFFPRNTGREALQMYLTAAVAALFGTGISFLSLKIGTLIAGLVTLPFIYWLGKEVAGRGAGLAALVLAGIAYWPNVIGRVALRFSLYPLFVAPTLYFLIRGLRNRRPNDFILAGLFLGLGLHGYTPFRIVPFVVVLGVGLYLLSRSSAGFRRQALLSLIALAIVSFTVFLPLARYAFDHPAEFSYRAFSRAGDLERPLPEPALVVFTKNLGKAMAMFNWDDGEIWPVSVTHRPALDVVSAALFLLGAALLLIRSLRRGAWLDLFLLLSIPMLMLPSILSLAYPNENPALNRTAGALVPVFLITGLALDAFLSSLKGRLPGAWGLAAALALGGILLTASASQNYDLVFKQYARAYALSSWNSTEIGEVIRDYTGVLGNAENAWVVAYPHWVDTRLVGMNAGFPRRDFAIQPDQLEETTSIPGPKLFIVNLADEPALQTLGTLYPQGLARQYPSTYENKDFWVLFVPEQPAP